jgi:hypothetical protein
MMSPSHGRFLHASLRTCTKCIPAPMSHLKILKQPSKKPCLVCSYDR